VSEAPARKTRAPTYRLMTRMGHDSPRAALIYQHASSGADRAIADALDLLITATTEKLPDQADCEHDHGNEGPTLVLI
jgi:hypothetical protein